MLKLAINRQNRIELISYTEESTLADLAEAAEEIRLNSTLSTLKRAECRGCGKCCTPPPPVLGLDLPALSDNLCKGDSERLKTDFLALPDVPTPDNIRKSISELKMDGLDEPEATLLYEYNHSEPVRFRSDTEGSCIFLKKGECSIYEARPYACRLYTCFMGERLSVLEEMIVAEGTWHAYYALGLLPASLIQRNPFYNAAGYQNVTVKSFEHDFRKSLDLIFKYF